MLVIFPSYSRQRTSYIDLKWKYLFLMLAEVVYDRCLSAALCWSASEVRQFVPKFWPAADENVGTTQTIPLD